MMKHFSPYFYFVAKRATAGHGAKTGPPQGRGKILFNLTGGKTSCQRSSSHFFWSFLLCF